MSNSNEQNRKSKRNENMCGGVKRFVDTRETPVVPFGIFEWALLNCGTKKWLRKG